MRVRAEVDAAVEDAAVGLCPEAALEGNEDVSTVGAEYALASLSLGKKGEWVQSGT